MVAPTAVPPVCRILDYGKYKYAQEKREREQKKGQKTQDIREIRLRPKIGIHDFDSKAKIAKKMLIDGDKVRVVVMFRGREITHADLGAKLLEKMVDSLKGAAGIEKQPLLDGKRLTMVLTPLPGHKPEVKEKAEPKEKKEITTKKETVEKVKEVQDAKT
jgi:translation initiation factor IF-3